MYYNNINIKTLTPFSSLYLWIFCIYIAYKIPRLNSTSIGIYQTMLSVCEAQKNPTLEFKIGQTSPILKAHIYYYIFNIYYYWLLLPSFMPFKSPASSLSHKIIINLNERWQTPLNLESKTSKTTTNLCTKQDAEHMGRFLRLGIEGHNSLSPSRKFKIRKSSSRQMASL